MNFITSAFVGNCDMMKLAKNRCRALPLGSLDKIHTGYFVIRAILTWLKHRDHCLSAATLATRSALT